MTVNMKKKLSESILDKFSIDFLRSQVLKNAYGNDDTVIAKLDPRVLLAWYLLFGERRQKPAEKQESKNA